MELDELEAAGAPLELPEDGLVLELLDDDGVALDPEALPLAGWSDEPGVELELEDEVLGVAGVALEPELLDWSFFSTSIVVELEDEPEGFDIDPEGEVLEPDDEDELGGVEAPRGAVSVRLQPYRPLTARAMGRTTKAVFFIRLMG